MSVLLACLYTTGVTGVCGGQKVYWGLKLQTFVTHHVGAGN